MAVILVVEDEEQVRVLAESFLQAEGNKTLSAATIEQAIALIEGEEPVDVLFVDLKIQDDLEGGLKLAKKAVEARPKLKVLYTSGQAVTDGHYLSNNPPFYRSPIRSSSLPRHSSPNSGSAVAQSKVWASHVAEHVTNRNLAVATNVRFSNRPVGVKRFQTIHQCSVDVARGLALLFGIGTKAPSIMGFANEVEQSIGRTSLSFAIVPDDSSMYFFLEFFWS